MTSSGSHLLVFGASGISGWACVKEALSFPESSTFSRVTGLTNRPLSIKDSYLPTDDRLRLVSGIDLTGSVDNVVRALKDNISDIASVTHAIFTAYIEKPDFEALRQVNTELVKTAATALDQVAPKLQSFVLQTGGKCYGVEFSDKLPIEAPLKESQPRIPKPYYDNIFYYTQHDTLRALSAAKPWTFSETRPDVIIGFTPGSNFMNAAQGLGLWLSLAREVHGAGAKIPFPGTRKSFTNTHTDTFQDILGRMNIFAAVHPEKCGNGEAINVADGEVVTWEGKWAGICRFFDLEGVPPGPEPYSIEDFVRAHEATWQHIVQKHHLTEGIFENFSWRFLYFIMTFFDFNREYDLSKAKSVNFHETIDTVRGYTTSFQRLRDSKIIP